MSITGPEQAPGVSHSLPQKPAQDNPPALSDLSPKDKPWDKHRANADTVADYYAYGGLERYSERVSFCSQLLGFKLVAKEGGQGLKFKLSSAHFCRVRHCPVCQWRRSLMWKARAYKALPWDMGKEAGWGRVVTSVNGNPTGLEEGM